MVTLVQLLQVEAALGRSEASLFIEVLQCSSQPSIQQHLLTALPLSPVWSTAHTATLVQLLRAAAALDRSGGSLCIAVLQWNSLPIVRK